MITICTNKRNAVIALAKIPTTLYLDGKPRRCPLCTWFAFLHWNSKKYAFSCDSRICSIYIGNTIILRLCKLSELYHE